MLIGIKQYAGYLDKLRIKLTVKGGLVEQFIAYISHDCMFNLPGCCRNLTNFEPKKNTVKPSRVTT